MLNGFFFIDNIVRHGTVGEDHPRVRVGDVKEASVSADVNNTR